MVTVPQAVTLQQDAQLALAIITRREDYLLARIFQEIEEYGRLSPHWSAAENLGIETYAIARRCRWARPNGKPDTNRARDAMEFLCTTGQVITVMRVAYPVRSYYTTVGMLQAIERQRKK